MRFLFFSGLLSLALLSGCATADETIMRYRVAGGETVELALTPQGPKAAHNKDVQVQAVGCLTNPETKQLFYLFSFTELKGLQPKKIAIEDVSDEQAVPLLTDDAPKLDEKRAWTGRSPGLSGDVPHLAWLYHLDMTVRIFRFRIVTGDNREIVLYQAAMLHPHVKSGMRGALGLK